MTGSHDGPGAGADPVPQTGAPTGAPVPPYAAREAAAELPDGPGYAGLATFCGRPWLETEAELLARRPDVAVVGAPFDIATTHRPGARFGPRALRALAYDPGTYHLDLGIEIFEWLDVVDAGDAHCPHGLTEASHANIRAKVNQVARNGIFPLIVGGDHSITWPAATAVAEAVGWGELGLLHFDAHADTADIIDGNLASHGTPMRRLIESGAVRGRNFVQVGLRGYWPPPDVFAWMRENGLRWHLMHEVWERGSRAVIADAIAEAVDGCKALYLSVDIDVLDPGFAPGTGTPEPGGMNPADLLRAVRQIALDTPLVAADIVEVSPPFDHADTTVNSAHRVAMEVFAALAHRRRTAAGGVPDLPGTAP
ncbi:agmatinase [Pseudofrankia inefficax]|uniref:Agmatinase n=1 Tax=Pseudofrankia inefficax (strain DSM 45817 / CECT 9037 / DDB 130130 / EuI1c) TaxID=298654 RepID=E3IYB0_PSEI1|nr:agmatinase [Pseudofrankia inefficax]ADP83855.1 agmatinase [Pseudofrankia inefficax]